MDVLTHDTMYGRTREREYTDRQKPISVSTWLRTERFSTHGFTGYQTLQIFWEISKITLDKYQNALSVGLVIPCVKMVSPSILKYNMASLFYGHFIMVPIPKNWRVPVFECYGFPITFPIFSISGNKPLSNLGQSESEKCLSLQNCHFWSTEWWLSFKIGNFWQGWRRNNLLCAKRKNL